MNECYDIDKLRLVFFKNPYAYDYLNGFYGPGGHIIQFFYVKDGMLIDIFKDKYIKGLYVNGEMPSFNYNSINRIYYDYFTPKEISDGVVSEKRLFQIYCDYNSYFLSYENFKNNDDLDDSVINLNVHSLKRKRDNLICYKNNGGK